LPVLGLRETQYLAVALNVVAGVGAMNPRSFIG